MSVLLRRSSCSSCLRFRLSRALSSTTIVFRPLPASSEPVSRSADPDRGGESACSSKAGKAPRKKKIVGSSVKRPSQATIENPPRNLLQETKLQDYLDHIALTSQDVSLGDIERYRPARHASVRSPEYEEEYNALVETLVRSFSLNQLRKFLEMYHLSAPQKRNKWELAVAIIERQWNWPSLKIIKQEKREWTESIHQSFPLDAKQSFLILGKDGADLLALSSEFNAHVSFSPNPLSLKVEGLRGSLSNLSRHIENFKAGIKEQLLQLPPGGAVDQESLQRISRISGVFTEDLGRGQIRISYKGEDESAAHFAKRLSMRAAVEDTQGIPTTLVCSAPSSLKSTMYQSSLPNSTYSLYPFLSSRSEPRVVNPGSLFRVRRVGDWLKFEDPQEAEGLAQGGVMSLVGESVDLRQSVLSEAAHLPGDGDSSGTRVTASFGHLLVCSGSFQGSSITPPLKGTPGLSTVLEWLQSHIVDRIFVPSLPPQLINSPPVQQRLLHRLVYHSFSTEGSKTSQATRVLNFELVLDLPNSSPSTSKKVEDSHSKGSAPEPYLTGEGIALETACWTGSFSHLHLMMPDRPMDVRFTISNDLLLAKEKWPKDLQCYFSDLRAFWTTSGPERPQSPLILTHEGTKYRLELSSIVRQSVDSPLRPLSSGSSLQTVTESILDSESNERSRVCQHLIILGHPS
ncbi:hypothetical protein D9615_005313 [Tricholomella constricta]|uniref:SLS1 N-terminal domain-containing protein n=1 Tax=Tricholomella constricta TaxID=117010 RepID=A0A8H5H682_9AGAR|nr:hypothetical protein D9615_005313 [Tricholomella constricta]